MASLKMFKEKAMVFHGLSQYHLTLHYIDEPACGQAILKIFISINIC